MTEKKIVDTHSILKVSNPRQVHLRAHGFLHLCDLGHISHNVLSVHPTPRTVGQAHQCALSIDKCASEDQ